MVVEVEYRVVVVVVVVEVEEMVDRLLCLRELMDREERPERRGKRPSYAFTISSEPTSLSLVYGLS